MLVWLARALRGRRADRCRAGSLLEQAIRNAVDLHASRHPDSALLELGDQLVACVPGRARRIAAALRAAVEREAGEGRQVAQVGVDARHRNRAGPVEDGGVGDELALDPADAGVLHRLGERAEARQRQVPGLGEARLRQRRIAVADEDQAALQGALPAPGALAALEDPRLEPAVPAELLEIGGRREELRVGGQDPRVAGAGIRVDEAVRVRVGVVDVGAGRAADRIHLVLEDPAQAIARDRPSWPPGRFRRARPGSPSPRGIPARTRFRRRQKKQGHRARESLRAPANWPLFEDSVPKIRSEYERKFRPPCDNGPDGQSRRARHVGQLRSRGDRRPGGASASVSKTALVLGGGGFTGGVYEIGALRALDLLAVNHTVNEFDIYVGTSAGSFIASLTANGVTPEEMMRVLNSDLRSPIPDIDLSMLLRPNYSGFVRGSLDAPAEGRGDRQGGVRKGIVGRRPRDRPGRSLAARLLQGHRHRAATSTRSSRTPTAPTTSATSPPSST